MTWGAVGAAGVGVFGGMLTNSGGQTSTSGVAPFNPTQANEDLDWLSDHAGTGTYYGGDTVADMDPLQTQGFDMTMNAADQIGRSNQQLSESMNMFMDPSFMDPNANPYMSQYVDAALRPLDQRYNEQIMPGIRGNARMTGGSDFGSTRQGVSEGIATRGYNDAVGDVTAGIYTDLYGKNIDAKQRAMSMNPMMAQMMGMPGQMYAGVGGAYQGQAQAEIGGAMNAYDYNRDIEKDDRRTNLALNAGTGGTTTTTGPGADPWTTGVGTALTAYGMMNPGGDTDDGWDAWGESWDTEDQYGIN